MTKSWAMDPQEYDRLLQEKRAEEKRLVKELKAESEAQREKWIAAGGNEIESNMDGYVSYSGGDCVQLDGGFTGDELRRIADTLEKVTS